MDKVALSPNDELVPLLLILLAFLILLKFKLLMLLLLLLMLLLLMLSGDRSQNVKLLGDIPTGQLDGEEVGEEVVGGGDEGEEVVGGEADGLDVGDEVVGGGGEIGIVTFIVVPFTAVVLITQPDSDEPFRE